MNKTTLNFTGQLTFDNMKLVQQNRMPLEIQQKQIAKVCHSQLFLQSMRAMTINVKSVKSTLFLSKSPPIKFMAFPSTAQQ